MPGIWLDGPEGSGNLLAANNLSDVAAAATAFANIKQAASTTASGVAELATTAEVNTGTDTTRAITPAGLAGSTLAVNQTRGIYADAAARDTAFSGILTEGQSAWLLDVNRETTYDGTSWLITGGVMPSINVNRKVVAQTIANGSVTTCAFGTSETEVEDTDGFKGAAADIITIPAGMGGDYLLTGTVSWATSSSGNSRAIWLAIGNNTTNGEGNFSVSQSHQPAGIQTRQGISQTVRLEAGATFWVQVYQNSGGNLDVELMWMQATMVRHIPTLT